MGEEKIILNICGTKKTYEKGTRYLEIVKEYQKDYADDIVLVSFDNRLLELHKRAKKSGELSFVTTADNAGRKTYRRSVTLLMQKALYNLLGKGESEVRVLYCISQAYYCELVRAGKPDEAFLGKLKQEMLRLSDEELPILKSSIKTDDAVRLFRDYGMPEKECLFHYRRSSRVNIYDLDHYKDYFYGYMTAHTGYLKYFDLKPYEDGFVFLSGNINTKPSS